MLDARRLLILRELAQRGSIARVAEHLNFTPSAVSQQLAALERETGIALIERAPRSVRLTMAGRVMVDHAHRVLAELEAAERAARDVADLRGGRLHLATFATAGAGLVPRAMKTFRERHPDVWLTLIELEPEQALEPVRTGELDLAITHQYSSLPRPDLRHLHQELLYDEPLFLAVPRTERSAALREVPLDAYADAEWIGSAAVEGFLAVTELACRAAGFEPRIPYRVESYRMVLALVAAGFGVALVPELAVVPNEAIVYVDITDPPRPLREIHITRRSADASPAVRAITLALHESAAAIAVLRDERLRDAT